MSLRLLSKSMDQEYQTSVRRKWSRRTERGDNSSPSVYEVKDGIAKSNIGSHLAIRRASKRTSPALDGNGKANVISACRRAGGLSILTLYPG
jgi:hypothetical protein